MLHAVIITPAKQAYIRNLSFIQLASVVMMMTMIMSVVVTMMFSLLARSKDSVYSISEFLDRSLESCL